MIHPVSKSIRKCDDGDFLYPCYKENCISNIPGTVLDLFGINSVLPKIPVVDAGEDEVRKVVLLVLDDFGYNQFLRHYKANKFLAKLAERTEVFPLTSIFPSQTTNALTTLNTGLTPQEHGLFEYYLYLKEVDKIVNTLRFEPIGSKVRNELVDAGFTPDLLFNGKTLQNTLQESGVKSFTHIYSSYAYSSYASLLFEDSVVVPSLRSSDLIVKLRKNLEKQDGPAYFFVHISNLDMMAHEYGPSSYEYSAELSNISHLLNKELITKVEPETAKETLILVTADHGGVDVVPENTVFLDEFPDLIANLRCDKLGKPILPTGSHRDVFLHVKNEKLTETKALLAERIGSKAKIVETEQAISDGLFGRGAVSSQFVDRAGNLLILPYRNETVWFDHFKSFKYNPVGQHGGLNEEEMLVPFAMSRLSNLK